MFPFTRVLFWVPIFDPYPYHHYLPKDDQRSFIPKVCPLVSNFGSFYLFPFKLVAELDWASEVEGWGHRFHYKGAYPHSLFGRLATWPRSNKSTRMVSMGLNGGVVPGCLDQGFFLKSFFVSQVHASL